MLGAKGLARTDTQRASTPEKKRKKNMEKIKTIGTVGSKDGRARTYFASAPEKKGKINKK